MSGFIVRLLNMSITASIIIAAVIIIRFLLKKAPKAFSYALWGVVLLRLLCPITISSQFSVFNLLHVNTNTTGELQYILETAKYDSTVMTSETATYVPDELPYIPTEGFGQEEHGYSQPMQFEQPLETQVVVRPNTDTVEELSPVVVEKEKLSLSSVINIVGEIWLAGVIVILFVNVISYLKLRNKAAACMKLQGNVYLSDEIDTPFCLGFFPAKIYLPSSLGEQERRYILMHEEYHIKRFDHVVKLFAFLALCIHWFNPLVWLAFVLAGKDMEMSCDEAVMRKMDTDIRVEYSTSLLHLATGRRFAPSPLAFGEGNPKDRIKNIMNYKKPAFWLIIVTIVVCVIVAVVLGTNPKTTEPGPDVTSSEEVESSEEEESKADTDEDEKQSDSKDSERESRVEAYMELIHLAETAIYDRESLGDNYKAYCDADGNSLFSSEVMQLYDGSGDIAYQNIGYLLQDIDGDGRAELLFGENDPKPDGDWDGIVYDMYTFSDNQLVHVFQGWNRCRYYLTGEGYITMQWSSSAFEWGEEYYQFDGMALSLVEKLDFNYTDKRTICTYTNADGTKTISEKEAETIQSKYHIVRPKFISIGPAWKMIGDINEDGRDDYMISTGRDNIYNKLALYLAGEGIVYERQDELFLEQGMLLCYEDLDRDGEKEIAFSIAPHVNSTSLMYYTVLKKTETGWRELQNYSTEKYDYSFPLHIVHDKTGFDIGIYCEGLQKSIHTNVEYMYQYWNNTEDIDSDTAAPYIEYYKNTLQKAPVGQEVGDIAPYGIWDIALSEFAGEACLVAEHGICGCSLPDFWGFVHIYFNYDAKGNVRVLDIQFTPSTYSQDNGKKEAYNAYADFFTTPNGLVGIDGYAPEQLVFSLEYIDGDDIPEMVIGLLDPPHASSTFILSFHDGELIVSREPVGTYGRFLFIEGTGIIIEEDYAMNDETLYYLRLESNGEIALLCSRERIYETGIEDESGKWYESLIETKCTVSGKNVSEEDFLTYIVNLEKDRTVKRWSSTYYQLDEDALQRLRDGSARIGMAGEAKKGSVELMHGNGTGQKTESKEKENAVAEYEVIVEDNSKERILRN